MLTDDRSADGGGDVIVTRRDVSDERTERVEGRLVADLLLAAHVVLELIKRD